jgi:hypothetical protein
MQKSQQEFYCTFFCLGFIKWAHIGVVLSTTMFCHISYQKVFNRLQFNLDTRVLRYVIFFFFWGGGSPIQYHSRIMWNHYSAKKQLTIEKSICYLKTFSYGEELIGLNNVSLDHEAQLARDLSLQSIKRITISQHIPCIHLDAS